MKARKSCGYRITIPQGEENCLLKGQWLSFGVGSMAVIFVSTDGFPIGRVSI